MYRQTVPSVRFAATPQGPLDRPLHRTVPSNYCTAGVVARLLMVVPFGANDLAKQTRSSEPFKHIRNVLPPNPDGFPKNGDWLGSRADRFTIASLTGTAGTPQIHIYNMRIVIVVVVFTIDNVGFGELFWLTSFLTMHYTLLLWLSIGSDDLRNCSLVKFDPKRQQHNTTVAFFATITILCHSGYVHYTTTTWIKQKKE